MAQNALPFLPILIIVSANITPLLLIHIFTKKLKYDHVGTHFCHKTPFFSIFGAIFGPYLTPEVFLGCSHGLKMSWCIRHHKMFQQFLELAELVLPSTLFWGHFRAFFSVFWNMRPLQGQNALKQPLFLAQSQVEGSQGSAKKRPDLFEEFGSLLKNCFLDPSIWTMFLHM